MKKFIKIELVFATVVIAALIVCYTFISGCSSLIKEPLNVSDASLSFKDNSAQTIGFNEITAPPSNKFSYCKGLYNKNQAIFAEDMVTFEASLDKPVGENATVMFWFKPDRKYQSQKFTKDWSHEFIQINNLCSISFHTRDNPDNCISMSLKWDKNVKGVHDLRILIPEISEQWVHLAFTWNSQKGIINGYINGTAYRDPDVTVKPWSMSASENIKINVSKLPFSDLMVFDRVLSSNEISTIVGPKYKGIFDRQLGAQELGQLKVENIKGPLIYENPLSSPQDLDGWVLEGPGNMDFENGWMKMYSSRPEAPNPYGHFVFWCDQDFPENFVAQWEYQLQSKFGLCIIFFSAKGLQGQSIFDPQLTPRDGVYTKYVRGDINCYGISYQANAEFDPARNTSNLRKNYGFYLAANGPVGIHPGDTDNHKVTLVKNGAHIQMAVDGRKIIDFTDDPKRLGPVLGAGKMGFRQMRWTVARYRNFKVYELAE